MVIRNRNMDQNKQHRIADQTLITFLQHLKIKKKSRRKQQQRQKVHIHALARATQNKSAWNQCWNKWSGNNGQLKEHIRRSNQHNWSNSLKLGVEYLPTVYSLDWVCLENLMPTNGQQVTSTVTGEVRFDNRINTDLRHINTYICFLELQVVSGTVSVPSFR